MTPLRHVIFLSLCLALTSMPLVASGPAAHWERVDLQSAAQGNYTDVQALSLNQGWLLSDAGKLWSLDGQVVEIAPGGQALFFLDSQLGWIVGDEGLVLQTSDGGDSWNPLPFPEPLSLQDVHFHTPNEGWVVGHDSRVGAVFHTINGGHRWETVDIGTHGRLYGLDFYRDTGWIVGERGLMFHTANKGQSWSFVVPPTTADIYGIKLTEDARAWFVGTRGAVLSTADNGAHWMLFDSLLTTDWYSVAFSDRSRGAIVGAEGQMLVTRNEGKTWEQQPTESRMDLQAVCLVDGLQGWAAGNEESLVDTLSGRSRTLAVHEVQSFSLSRVTFADRRHGWAVGSNGLIWHTQNDGISWNTQETPTQARLSDVAFLDRNTGWAVGEAGTVLHTIDGGNHWYAQRTGVDGWLTSVFFMDTWNGWAVGHDSLVLRTQDGGRSWKIPDIEAHGYDFADVYFIDASRGWIIGRTLDSRAAAAVFTTENGGEDWLDRSSDFSQIPALWSLDFHGSSQGVMVGDQGTVLLTQDGGLSWYWTTPPTKRSLHYATHDEQGTAWVVGQSGTLLRRVDEIWHTETLPVRRLLTGITVVDGRAWVVGDTNSVWHSLPAEPIGPSQPVLTVSRPQETVLEERSDGIPETGGVDQLIAPPPQRDESAQTFASHLPPSPRFLWVMLPEKAQIGVPLTIDVAVMNEGGDASQGEITVSLPDSSRFLIVDHDTTDAQSYATGASIWSAAQAGAIVASYPMIEAAQEEWHSTVAHALKLRVLPTRRGILNVYVRAALRDADGNRFITPDDGIRDQQGFPVKHYQISVD